MRHGLPRPPLLDTNCGRRPSDIATYVAAADQAGSPSAEDFVWLNEATLNHVTGHFLCDACYVALGLPGKHQPGRWVAS